MSEGTLRALAAGLCADRGVRVMLGRAWCYHGDSHTIEVPEHQLEELGPIACAGIIAHEVGHAWLSRYHAFAPTGVIPTATMLALNAMEDGRVERWMIGRYPGVARWLGKAHADPGEEPGTPLLTFLLACVRAGELALPVALNALTRGPRRVLNMGDGRIESGAAADLTLLDPQAKWTLDATTNKSKSRNTVLWGRELTGRTILTVFRGKVVFRA